MEKILNVTMIPGEKGIFESKHITEEEYSKTKAMIDGGTMETIKSVYGTDFEFMDTLCVEIPSSLIATEESTDVFSIDGVTIDKTELKEQGFDCIICVPNEVEYRLKLKVIANTKDSLNIFLTGERSNIEHCAANQ